MNQEYQGESKSRITTIDILATGIVIGLLAAIMYPVLFDRGYTPSPKSSCQSNMKELGTAYQMYFYDYNGTLPSSAILGSKIWDESNYRHFATKRGTLPPSQTPADTWPELLYSHMKNTDIIWCPDDQPKKILFYRPHNSRKGDPNATVSYWYKAAIDRAWYGGTDKNGKHWSCRNEKDFIFPSDQIIFYEHTDWHWSGKGSGPKGTMTLNAVFMDGHVRPVSIKAASKTPDVSDPVAVGEPAWFNQDYSAHKTLKTNRNFDPRTQGDLLR